MKSGNDTRWQDCLKNKGTSRVFYAIATGADTPKSISEKLRIRPPSIMDQLHRLNETGLVELGLKTGKFQHYRINHQRLAEVCVDLFPDIDTSIDNDKGYAESIGDKSLLKGPTQGERLRDRMRQSPGFADLVWRFFERLSFLHFEASEYFHENRVLETAPTLWETIEEFEKGLERAYPSIEWKDNHRPEIVELREILRDWYEAALSFHTMESLAFEDSLGVVGLT